jgi:hypothetical protein
MGSWRNTCSKTLRAKNGNDGNDGIERERERKSSSITIAQDMVSWE